VLPRENDENRILRVPVEPPELSGHAAAFFSPLLNQISNFEKFAIFVPGVAAKLPVAKPNKIVFFFFSTHIVNTRFTPK
jgi:hypothetical protein